MRSCADHPKARQSPRSLRGKRSSAATREKPVHFGITSCAQGGTLGLSVLPNCPRLSHVWLRRSSRTLRRLLPRRLLARLFHQGRAQVGCDGVHWQGCSRDFGQLAVRLRNGQRLHGLVRPARVRTVSTEGAQVRTARAREAESGHKQSLRTVCT